MRPGRISKLSFITVYLPVLLVIGFLAIGMMESIILRQHDADVIRLRVDEARRICYLTRDILRHHHQRWKDGELSISDARRLAFAEIQALKYSGDGHFFVLDFNGVVLADGSKPELVGQKLYDTTDASGQPVVKELLKRVMVHSKEAVVYSSSAAEADSDPAQMPDAAELDAVYYAARFSPWALVVGTEIDGQEIRDAHNELVYEEMLHFGFVILIMTPIFLYLRHAAAQLIRQLEAKNRSLEQRESELLNSLAFFKTVTETAPDPIVLVNMDGTINFCSRAVYEVFERGDQDLSGEAFNSLFAEPVSLENLMAQSDATEVKGRRAGCGFPLRLSVSDVVLADGRRLYTAIMQDLSLFKQLESELSQAQKLESVGQLAAGIAHEINTPSQFIRDNLQFVDESVNDIIDAIGKVKSRVRQSEDVDVRGDVDKLLDGAEIDYLASELPRALSESRDGIDRVASIVQAMKHYAHPGESLQQVDLNGNIEKTIIVSKSEWKYHAEMITEFCEDLPAVECIPSDINQVVLNMVVNAGHAIADRQAQNPDHKGEIRVSTATDGQSVTIEIADNGLGMSEQVQQRVFDPFFTTKEVGKGTGQGLSIALKIVSAHGGSIALDSESGRGTAFTITLPIEQDGGQGESRAA